MNDSLSQLLEIFKKIFSLVLKIVSQMFLGSDTDLDLGDLFSSLG